MPPVLYTVVSWILVATLAGTVLLGFAVLSGVMKVPPIPKWFRNTIIVGLLVEGALAVVALWSKGPGAGGGGGGGIVTQPRQFFAFAADGEPTAIVVRAGDDSVVVPEPSATSLRGSARHISREGDDLFVVDPDRRFYFGEIRQPPDSVARAALDALTAFHLAEHYAERAGAQDGRRDPSLATSFYLLALDRGASRQEVFRGLFWLRESFDRPALFDTLLAGYRSLGGYAADKELGDIYLTYATRFAQDAAAKRRRALFHYLRFLGRRLDNLTAADVERLRADAAYSVRALLSYLSRDPFVMRYQPEIAAALQSMTPTSFEPLVVALEDALTATP